MSKDGKKAGAVPKNAGNTDKRADNKKRDKSARNPEKKTSEVTLISTTSKPNRPKFLIEKDRREDMLKSASDDTVSAASKAGVFSVNSVVNIIQQEKLTIEKIEEKSKDDKKKK